MSQFVRVVVEVMVVALVFAGCAPDLTRKAAVTSIGEPAGVTVTTTVGSAGGTVRSADGELQLIVPAGALAADTALTVTPISATAPNATKAWRLGPEGTTFSQPATVKMTFSQKKVGTAAVDAMRIVFQDSERRWQFYEPTIEGNTIAVQTTHLSDWSLVHGWQLRPDDPFVQVGDTVVLKPIFCGFMKEPVGGYIAECLEDHEGLDRFFINWAVNGIPGGNSEVGTVQGGPMARTYTAPSKLPPGAEGFGVVDVSVEWNPPQEPGEVNPKFILVSQPIIWDKDIRQYTGTVRYHLKKGGPGTSTLPMELQMSAQVTLNRSSDGVYDLVESAATLESYTKVTDIANCTCTASNIMGTIQSDTGALTLRDGKVSSFQFGALISVPFTCGGTTNSACSNHTALEVVPWSLAGQNPNCMNTVDDSYSDPVHVDGSWSTTCPVNPQLLGRIEGANWSLNGLH